MRAAVGLTWELETEMFQFTVSMLCR